MSRGCRRLRLNLVNKYCASLCRLCIFVLLDLKSMFPHVEINRQLVVVGLISNTADVVVLVIVRPYQLTIGLL